jgi:uncharacterized protein YndB with AHSA1/START domain/predicted enzyme related to lactoylglutathione lyase
MSTPVESTSLQVTRLIKAPRERVFAAWTTPDQVKHWFGPAACQVLDAQIDLRPGGAYRFKVFSDSMGEMAVGGEYREITSPSKLVFTWKWEDDENWADITSVVTVDFVEKDGGTEVRIAHEGLPSGESAGRHEHGWNGCLDKLQAREAVCAELRGPGHFSWNELLAADVESAAAFYTSLLGWTAAPMAGGMPYTLFKKDGSDVGGLMKLPMPGIPPHWLNYVTVEACDATAARVTELGGKICAPPFDIPNVGRIAVVQDPQGAAFGLFQPARP